MEDKRFDDVVYCPQLTVEQSVKSVLISLAIVYPKGHDVSEVFIQLAKRKDLPKWFREKVNLISETMVELAELRELAGYGFEKGIDANYFENYAPEALKKAEETYETCRKLLIQLFKKENFHGWGI